MANPRARNTSHPPTAQDLFNIDTLTQSKLEEIQFSHTTDLTDKANVFQGHATRVYSNADVQLAYKKIRLLFPEADNIPMAYTFKDNIQGHHDNSEHGAGAKMKKILIDRGMKNTAVFVTRNFSGIHIGQRRFMHIEQLTRQSLDAIQAQT